MGEVHFIAVTDLNAYLVDGYLPERDIIIKLAEQSAENPALNRNRSINLVTRPPYSWDEWDEDDAYETLAFNVRKIFCASRPPDKSSYIWSEAWLLKSKHWPIELELKEERHDTSNRRLLVSLYEGCGFGKKCLTNLIKQTRFDVIPPQAYRDYGAFKRKGQTLLDDISLPFRAPCLAAGDRMQAQGYEYKAFGN